MKTCVSEKHDPRVTVFMPAFNAARYIAQAIESVLAQTYTDFELLIIDDGSTDDTSEAIRGFATDTRLRALSHIQNLGQPHTRNHGLALARGEYVAFLDADDLCVPQRLARQVAYLNTHRDVAGVGSCMELIDDHAQPLAEPGFALPLHPDEITCRMLFECSLAQTSMMARTRALSNYRYDTAFRVAQDYELWSRMIATCRFANLPEALSYYRRHATQLTATQGDAQRAADLKIYGLQVDALGLQANSDDLVRHECLFKFQGRRPVLERTGAPLDIEYLRWARTWLQNLREANARCQIYPEPAFSDMLAMRWLFACRKAARNSPWLKVAIELFGSSLRRAVTSYAWRRLQRRLSAQRGCRHTG